MEKASNKTEITPISKAIPPPPTTNTPQNKKSFSIKSWAEADRPREKLLAKGRQVLSDAELIAILIGSGSRTESAVQLAQRILQSVDNNLNELGRRTIKDLMKFKGIGEAKAITIAAALEFGRRRQLSDVKERPKITCSRDAYNCIAPILTDLPHEEFWILLLNRANMVMSRQRISTGGVAGTVVDIKMIFKCALEHTASSIILSHNHPSGNLTPSQADINITKKIKSAGQVLDIGVLDHLIISYTGYYSLADESKM